MFLYYCDSRTGVCRPILVDQCVFTVFLIKQYVCNQSLRAKIESMTKTKKVLGQRKKIFKFKDTILS